MFLTRPSLLILFFLFLMLNLIYFAMECVAIYNFALLNVWGQGHPIECVLGTGQLTEIR